VDKEEPSKRTSSTERDELKMLIPNMDSELPRRVKLLILKADPRCTKSTTEIEDPKRRVP
jgi:hypothetical protein